MNGYNFTDRVRTVLLFRWVRYEKLPDGYALDLVTWKGGKPELSHPPEFWHGLGIRRTNVEGLPSP